MTLSFDVGDSLEALNAGLFVSPGFGTHAERVIDSHELIFVIQGRLDMFEENRSFAMLRNQTLLLSPGRRHGGLLPYAPDVNFYWVHFRVLEPTLSHGWVQVPKVATIRNPEGLTELFCRFISDQESGTLDPVSAAHLVSLMLCAVGDDGRAPPEAPDTDVADDHAALGDRVQAYIDAHFPEPISTRSIAVALRYNPDYLERVFRTRMRMSILDALHQKRIGAARALLHTEAGKNINEIAFQCGYTDPGYFRRMFKRVTGLTPREFRTLYARTHINTH
ncbi:MAG TPA: AraC family transcriptional regulator [Spirochaetia bacterium]|nr:AraC family transcriptional regulator [Spirochaetia bacterium]